MQDESMVDDEAAAKAKRKEGRMKEGKVKEGKKAKDDPAATGDETNMARLLIRAMWTYDWTEANTDKSVAERSVAWKEARQSVNDAELKKMRKVMIGLKRLGVTMTAPEKTPKAENQADDDTEE